MPDTDKDLNIVIPDDVQAQLDADPKMAEAMRGIFASMRQAHADVASGKYAAFDDAMEAITGNRPEPVELEDI